MAKRPRIIPCLLLRKTGLVKGEKFANHRYVGDVINAVRIFNDKGVDEIIVLDIDATREKREPNYELIEQIAGECFMPLAYGGGITRTGQMEKLFRLGCEKVCINSAVANVPGLIEDAASRFGRQSIVVAIDAKKKLLGGYDAVTHAGSQKLDASLDDYVRWVTDKGAGEIMIQSVARDGTQTGYDLELVERVVKNTKLPVIAAGGASGVSDLAAAIKLGASAAAAGALFVFQGKHRAVLINVPTAADISRAMVNV